MKLKIIDEAFFQNLELLNIYLKDNVAGAFGGNHRSKKYGSSSEFADYRDYVPGDDVRRIDWNVFSRFEKLYLKLFLDERQMHHRIYIDGSKSMENKKEHALKLAVAFAYMAVKAMDKVSIYLITGHKTVKLLNRVVGKESFLNAIASIDDVAFQGESFISDAILYSGTGYGNGMSVIISDFLTDNDFKSSIGYLRSKHRDVTCVQLLTQEEIDPSYSGKNILFDSENPSRYYKKNIRKENLKAYLEALEYIKNDIYSYCTSRGANYLFASTEENIDRIILHNAIKKEIVK
mgnify:CR=1 FL=1